jgi:hypothetical protein
MLCPLHNLSLLSCLFPAFKKTTSMPAACVIVPTAREIPKPHLAVSQRQSYEHRSMSLESARRAPQIQWPGMTRANLELGIYNADNCSPFRL